MTALYMTTAGWRPPMAVAACAMKAISDRVMLPPGVVHTHGDIRFSGTANTGETIDCYGKVSQQLKRGSLTLLTMDFSICNHKGETIFEGQTGFILPEDSL